VSSLVAVFSAVLGLAVGSFLNVVIWRVPRGESVVRPGSHCPRCDRQLTALDNVPVVSWLVLRGRCRSCREPISARYPAVELLTGATFAVVAWKFGPHAVLPAFLYLSAAGIALSFIDIDHKRLPNAITLPSYAVIAVLLAAASAASGEWGPFARALIGCAALFGFYFLIAIIAPRGMGFGDVKLAGVLGLSLGYLGWGELITGTFLAFLYGGLFGMVLLALRRGGRKTAIPFGPWMVLGAMTAVFVGGALARGYLAAFGL
jgi:leader peptidase (prepilin peptidase)/N-methyltransferase